MEANPNNNNPSKFIYFRIEEVNVDEMKLEWLSCKYHHGRDEWLPSEIAIMARGGYVFTKQDKPKIRS